MPTITSVTSTSVTSTSVTSVPKRRWWRSLAELSAAAALVLAFMPVASPTEAQSPSSGLTWQATQGPTNPPLLTDGEAAYDASARRVLLYSQGQSWTWDGSAWTAVTASGGPTSDDPALAYDPATKTVVLFGGRTGSYQDSNATWLWNGSAWTQAGPTASPSPREGAAMAYDAATGTVVLFGGTDFTNPPPGSNAGYPDTTWTWDGTTWTRMNPTTSPPNLTDAAMAYDPASGLVVLFGGYDTSGVTSGATWTWNGQTWTQVSSAESPAPRGEAAMTYDPALGGVVLFGGQDASADHVYNDTWLWTQANGWRPLSVASAPPQQAMASLAYDGAAGQLVLTGGFPPSSSQPIDTTWVLAGGGGDHVTLSAGATVLAPGATTTVTATVRSAGGAPVSGDDVTFTASCGTLNPTTAVTGADGTATVSLTACATSGSATVTAEEADTQSQGTLAIAVGPAPPASSYTFTAVWQGRTVDLTPVTNVTVEDLPDATLVGQVSGFATNEPQGGKPPFYCLDGESLNVWTAPSEFPGVYVVHNGDQGSQCTYGTWTFPESAPPPPVSPKSVSVSATQGWVDSGIAVAAGDEVRITATGTINDGSIYPQNATATPKGLGMVSADGYSCTSNLSNPQPEPYLVASVPCESLVGAVVPAGAAPPTAPAHPSATVFEVGASNSFVALTSGELYLAVNDNFFPDNSGAFTATVSVTSFPGIALRVGSDTGYAAGVPVTAPTPPVIIGGYTMVPLRFLSELLGASVQWNPATRSVIIESPSGVVCFGGACRIIMTVGRASYEENGRVVPMGAAPAIVGSGYTVVPLRFVAEAFGRQVIWNPALQEVIILPPAPSGGGGTGTGGNR